MSTFNFCGMMAPTFAPMNDDGSLKLELIPAYAQHLYNTGVTGVYVNGTSGEGMSLTQLERCTLAEAWMKQVSLVPTVVIQVGGAGCLQNTQELAHHAESLGVAAIAFLPCLYDPPADVDDLIDYAVEVAKAAPKTPLLYYHIPFKTHVELSMSAFLEKGFKVVPSLVGLKFTSADVADEGAKCLALHQSAMVIFSGFDETLAEALGLGFEAAINVCFNFLAYLAKEIFTLTAAGNLEEAKKVQEKLSNQLKLIFKQTGGFSVSAAKAAHFLFTGIDVGPVRKPLRGFTQLMKNNLEQDLVQAGLIVRP